MDKYLDLEFHPLANIFPLLEGEELRALADDIAQHGLRRKIVIGGGKILDGRNRWRAAQLVKFPLTERHFTEFTGADSLAYVISANVRRRQMNESQRALTAALLSNVRMDGCADLRITQAESARMLNVSLRLVTDARLVLDRGPDEMITEIEAGRLSVTPAAEELRSTGERAPSYSPPAEPPRQREEPRIVQRQDEPPPPREDEPPPTAPTEFGAQHRRQREIAGRAAIRALDVEQIAAWLDRALDSQRREVAVAAFAKIRADADRWKVAEVILPWVDEIEKGDASEPG